MAWTKSKSGGFTKYTQTLLTGAADTITLAGAGALISTVEDVLVSTSGVSGEYAQLFETAVGGVVSIPKGAHMLKLTDDAGGGVVTVYVENNSTGQGSMTIGGIGADPS